MRVRACEGVVDRRLGIDVGGTFTDFVLLQPSGITIHKRPSTPADPLLAVREGIAALGLPDDTPVVHGTTIVTNAVLQARGARTAICLLFSFLRPDHERQIAAEVRRRLPRVFVSCSSDVAPEFREYERASTTVVDAFVGPLAAGYLQRLRQAAPHVQLMQSAGG